MKSSKKNLPTSLITLAIVASALFLPAGPARAEFTDLSQLGSDIDALERKLQTLQKLPGFQNVAGGGTSPLTTALQNVSQINDGIHAFQKVLNIPVIAQNGGFQSAAGLNDSIQGLGAILDTPLFSNFEGASKLKSTISTVGNAAQALSNIGKILDIPELKSLGGLIDTGSGSGTSGIGTAVSGIFGGASGQSIQPQQIISGLAKLNSIASDSTNAPVIGAMSAISEIAGAENLTNVLSKIPVSGTGLANAGTGTGCEALTSSGAGSSSLSGGSLGNLASSLGISQGIDAAKTAAGNAVSNAAGGLASSLGISSGVSAITGAANAAVSGISSIFGGAIGGTNGVPVVEQDGTLIKLQKQNTQLSAVICQHLQIIRYIEEFKNPEAHKSALDKLSQTIQNYNTEEATGRTTAQGTKGSFIIDQQSYINEKVRARTALVVKQLSASPMSTQFKDAVMKQIVKEQTIGLNQQQGIVAAVQGTQLNSADPMDNWLESVKDYNTPYGAYLIANTEIARAQGEAATEAANTWAAGQGLAPDEVCETGYIDTELGPTCEKYTVKRPGIYLANRGSVIRTSGIRVAEASDKLSEDIDAQKALAEEQAFNFTGDNQGRKDFGISDVFNIVDNICRVKSDLGICSAKNAAASTLNTLSQLTGTNILSALSGSSNGGSSAAANVSSTAVTAGTPTITTSTRFQASETSSDTTTFAWQTNNASQCTAGNDWITFGLNGDLSTTPSVAIPAGTDVSTQNAIAIAHPSGFKVSAQTLGSGSENLQGNISTSFSGDVQTTVFTPNLKNIDTNTQFVLTLSGITLTTKKPLSGIDAAHVVADIKSAKVNLEAGSSAKAELDQYQFSGTDSLIIRRTLRAQVPSSQDYVLTCQGSGGRTTKVVTINF